MNSKKISKVSSVQYRESHTDAKSVCLFSDSVEGKNSISKRTPNTIQLLLAIYNIRTMKSQENLVNLEKDLEFIKWYIFCETRFRGDKRTVLKSAHILYQNNSNAANAQGGVALFVSKRLKHLLTEVNSNSVRVIYMNIRFGYNSQFIHKLK